ncbi:16S ribosomal RNA methyltransferase RsmE [Glycocaulis alkaliphilus]|uniref:Ribosomal RNA small subunit methyltransferase E n=1 Tax=Glycocaulis alkaliphilus TaxID=1434191 RepID=A0A3T0E7Y8_9PROT|nr:16S rRNA (uracil(1498)-N(3))-methyltransferase [Glycocaulis alkaliphilus]AZU03503.1 16S ribosomal RNA methyltransferase RsmE [Glycocaulis alkaliphilus]GGB74007.1 ribosomal RNA small subunit methyltransferase E [Glycocaulis alkaliphilus]
MVTTPRLFVDAPLSEGAELILPREQAHYLVNVMRREAGAPVRVFNGRDGEWQTKVAEASRKGASLQVETRLREQTGVPPLRLCFAPVKKARTDFIVEKATELGAACIQPVITRRTQSERVRTDRLLALATEAAEQTERLCLPEMSEPVSLERLLACWPDGERLIFCDEAGDGEGAWGGSQGRARPLADMLQGETDPSGPWTILIGPEGGFDDAERTHLRSLPFVRAVTLGPRILRADTAAVAALTLWQAALGDWR